MFDPPAPPTSPPNRPERFKLYAVSFVISILALFGSLARGVSSSTALSTRLGEWFGGLLLALFIGWGVFRLSGRSNVIGNVLFSVILLVSLAAPALTTARNKAAMDALRMQKAAEIERVAGELDRSGEFAGTVSDWDRQIDQVEKTAANSADQQAKVLRAAATVMRETRPAFQAYDAANDQLEKAGGLKPATLQSKEAILDRNRMVAAFRQANDRLAAHLEQLPTELSRRLKAPSEADRIALAREFAKGMNLELIVAIRAEDRRMSEAMSGLLQVLADEWGQWSVDDDSKRILFERDEAIAAYGRWVEQVRNSAQQQRKLQLEVIDRARSSLRK